ncbi:MAG: beta-galactosidase trimerization domain-containing protein, partial [Candidatus Omnitrophica bacterium]|nr:beta-galactosidase trimerization domain-containing protein [Candidatus Omnitrophota bacterium]
YQTLIAKWPKAIIMMNHYNRPNIHSASPDDGTSWKYGVPIDVMKFPGGGGNENTSVINRLHTTGFNARIVKAQCPHRFDVWEPGGTLWRSASYPELENDPTHSLLHGLWTLALGGVPWTALTNVLTKHGKPNPRVMTEWKKRRPFIGGKPLSYCGIHYSQASRDFWGRENPNAYYSEVYGFYDAAVEGHFLTDLLLDAHLADLSYLQRYRVVILPNSACLSETQGKALTEFVQSGGILIASFETSLYDQDGQRRNDFLLRDVLGVSYQETVQLTPGPWGKTIYDPDNLPEEKPIVRVENKHLQKKVGLTVFFGANYTRAKLLPETKVLANIVRLERKGPLFPWEELTQATIDTPAVVYHSFGKGKAIYFSPEAGRGFLHWPHPELRRLLETMFALGNPDIIVRAPKVVEVTAFQQKNDILTIHLVNLPWASNRPPVPPIAIPVIDEIIPITGIQVEINTPGDCRILLPLSREKPLVKRKGSRLVITVPSLKYHEVIVVRN